MKTCLFIILNLAAMNVMAMSNSECVQAQINTLDKTKVVRELTELHVRAIDTDSYTPTIKFEGRSKVTIEAAFNPLNGVCVTASALFIDGEAVRQNN